MKRYLIRGCYVPGEALRPFDTVAHNAIGGNSGNLMFQHGVMRVLGTEDAAFSAMGYRTRWTDREIDRINSSCDAVILPMADAFRDSFIPDLEGYTALIKEVTGIMPSRDKEVTVFMVPENTGLRIRQIRDDEIGEYGTPLGVDDSILGGGEIIE